MKLTPRNFLPFFTCFVIGIVVVFMISRNYMTYRIQTSMEQNPKLNIIQKTATDVVEASLSGYMFDAKDQYQKVTHVIKTGTVHWFSPLIENEAKLKFLGPPYENTYRANEAAIGIHNDEVMLVARVWLHKERMWEGTIGRLLKNKVAPVRNNFNDNWLYYQHFDRSLMARTYSSLLGIPTPSQYKYMDGPSDPRFFVYKNEPYVLFNMDMALNETHDINHPIIWDFKNKGPVWVEIEGGSPFWNEGKSVYTKERHWSPLVSNDELYFIYTLDPMRVLTCDLGIDKCVCTFLNQAAEGPSGFLFNDGISHLRGGTPFILYKWPYYIAFAHSMFMVTGSEDKVYSTHLVVVSIDTTFRVVYVSDGMKFNPKLYEHASKLHDDQPGPEFVVPVGLFQEAPDIYCLSVNVNDQGSALLRMTGLDSILQDVMSLDEYRKPASGPSVNSVQEYLHKTMSLSQRTQLVHQEL